MLAAAPARATNWDYIPQVALGTSYDTNVLYTSPQYARAVGGIYGDGRVDLIAETELNSLIVTPRVRSIWYPGSENSDLNNTDLYLSGSEVYTGSRNRLSLAVEGDRVSARTSEFQPAVPENPNQPPPAGSGRVVGVDDFRTIYQAAPSWRFLWDPRTTLEWTASAATVKYSQTGLDRFDYRTVDSSVSLGRSLTPALVIKLTGSGSFFKTAEGFQGVSITNNTVQAGASGTVQYSWSDTLDTGATLGWTHSTARLGSPLDLSTGLPCVDPGQFPDIVPVRCHSESSQNNGTGEIFLRKRAELTTANVTLSQAISPSSRGYTVKQLQFSAFLIRDVTARLSGQIGVNWVRQDSLAKISTRRTDYGNAQVGASWRLREQWSVNMSYGFYITQESGRAAIGQNLVQEFGSTTRNHQVSLQLQWRGLASHP